MLDRTITGLYTPSFQAESSYRARAFGRTDPWTCSSTDWRVTGRPLSLELFCTTTGVPPSTLSLSLEAISGLPSPPPSFYDRLTCGPNYWDTFVAPAMVEVYLMRNCTDISSIILVLGFPIDSSGVPDLIFIDCPDASVCPSRIQPHLRGFAVPLLYCGTIIYLRFRARISIASTFTFSAIGGYSLCHQRFRTFSVSTKAS